MKLDEDDCTGLQSAGNADQNKDATPRLFCGESGRLDFDRAAEIWQRWAAMSETTDDAVIGRTASGMVTGWNPGAERVFGYSAAEATGRPMQDLFSAENAEEERGLLSRVSRGEIVRRFECVRARKDGKRIHLSMTLSPIIDGNGRVSGVSQIARDITEPRTLAERLRQAQRMEAIGHLAAGIAHDFSNVLSVMGAYVGIMLNQPGIDEETRGYLTQLSAVTERAGGLPRQLLAFGRKGPPRPATLDLNKVVGDMAKILRQTIGENLRLQLECDIELPPIHADAGMIEQLLMNLTLNSRDAMPSGGVLSISTSRVVIDAARPQSCPQARAGEFVALCVGDTGRGIKPEHLARIFEPFFTAKMSPNGAGLGLATVFNIVEQHQGWVEIQSRDGGGTSFKALFPRMPAPESPVVENVVRAAARAGGESVLLVEDEPQLRRLARKTLERRGFKVAEAGSGTDALSVWNGHSGRFDLLITDMVMPEGMNGVELIENLRQLNPALKIVLMSGYCMDSSDTPVTIRDDVFFLQKPFLPEKLAETARKALDA